MCWRSDPRARVLCIGYVSMVTALMGSGVVAAGITIYAHTFASKASEYNVGSVLESIIPTIVVLNVLHHTVSVSLACGAQRESHRLLLPWLAVTAVAIVAALLGVIVLALKHHSGAHWTAPLVLWAVLNAYFWADVLRYYKILRESANRRREHQHTYV